MILECPGLHAGEFLEPAREIVLIRETEFFPGGTHVRVVAQELLGFLEEESVAVFTKSQAGGLFEDAVEVIRLVAHAGGESADLGQGGFAVTQEALVLFDEGRIGSFPDGQDLQVLEKGVQDSERGRGHQQAAGEVTRIRYLREFGELLFDVASLGLAETIEGESPF